MQVGGHNGIDSLSFTPFIKLFFPVRVLKMAYIILLSSILSTQQSYIVIYQLPK